MLVIAFSCGTEVRSLVLGLKRIPNVGMHSVFMFCFWGYAPCLGNKVIAHLPQHALAPYNLPKGEYKGPRLSFIIDKIIEPRALKALGDLFERDLILRSYHERQRGLGLLLIGNWKHILKETFSLRHNYIISVVVPDKQVFAAVLKKNIVL